MNEKFWDLSKEKQDRILNAALKIFAINGFKRASTDDMVREAGISKGLLFHYFISKTGLYEYVYEYSARYMRMELSPLVNEDNTGYFEKSRQIEQVKHQVMRNYPFMQLFLDRADEEEAAVVGANMKEKQAQYQEFIHTLYENTEFPAKTVSQNRDDCIKMIEIIKKGVMEQNVNHAKGLANAYFTEVSRYLNLLESMMKEPQNS